jgi:Immunity protein 51
MAKQDPKTTATPKRKAAPKKSGAALFSDKTTYSPFTLFEYDHSPGNYCLMLSDSHMLAVIDLFEAAGRSGHGYDWETICKQLVRTRAPKLQKSFRTDPEAGMFVAYGPDLEALKELGGLMHEAFHSKTLLSKLIADAPEKDWD